MSYLMIKPDQLCSAGGYISREWGDYGYSIEEIESPTHAVSLFHVCASDGSRFTVLVDKWGNCRHADTHAYTARDERLESLESLVPLIKDMHASATQN